MKSCERVNVKISKCWTSKCYKLKSTMYLNIETFNVEMSRLHLNIQNTEIFKYLNIKFKTLSYFSRKKKKEILARKLHSKESTLEIPRYSSLRINRSSSTSHSRSSFFVPILNREISLVNYQVFSFLLSSYVLETDVPEHLGPIAGEFIIPRVCNLRSNRRATNDTM